MTNIKAELIYYANDEIQDRYILEMTIYWVGVSERYRDGIKYGFILVDPYSNKRVLMDNHYPKGPHVHLDDNEIFYEYVDDEKLIRDFKYFVFTHMGVKL